ncbi:hypothetical protein FMEAI12_4020094 [Parafrankia sp. Ea1.12]|nr:hypothetical protein FMEAI12_4020094 [Parafrankia sp. Ea1.12]
MVPANRLASLARYGLASKAPSLAELAEPRRTATLLAVSRHLDAVAVDDALDLFALLMATKLINPSRQASNAERLGWLPRLERASRVLALAGRALVDVLDAAATRGRNVDVAAAWAAVEAVAPRERVAGAIAVVEELVPDGDSRMRLAVERLEALEIPASLEALRARTAAMLPRVDLPELLLEVHAWTGFLDAYVHVSGAAARIRDLPLSAAALLVAEGCNVGLTPVMNPNDEALTRGRLSHVDQNYLRAETHTAANAALIDAQSRIPIAAVWGGGLLASVDGLRFVVPVRTLNAGPSPKYFGYKRGLTWRMLGRDGHPTPLGQAFAEYGRIAKTLHLLAMVDPLDDTHRRAVNTQTTVQESRHKLARTIFHGRRGQIYQAYREGQEDQLGALGLVLNAVVLWNTRYLDAAVTALRQAGHVVYDADIARLSPLGHAHLNCLGRYSFSPPSQGIGLRPLRSPEDEPDEKTGP